MDRKTQEKKLSKVLAQAWLDPEFCQRLRREPAVVLREVGLNLDDLGTGTLSAAAASPQQIDVHLGPRPASLGDDILEVWNQLAEAVPGFAIMCRGCMCC